MLTRRFRQLDVFTTVPYFGNPVAVVLDADGLSPEEMQRYARWTNLSETTFLLPPTDADADYRLRIFTPARELPFAGHPTLGSCQAWLDAGGSPRLGDLVVQECEAGLVAVRRIDPGLAFAAPPLVRSGPVGETDLAAVAGQLGIDRGDIVDAHWVDNGPGWVAVWLASEEAVLALRPSAGDLFIGAVAPRGPGAEEAIEVRGFFSANGQMVEDPVTGSLNAALAGWLISSGRLTAPYVARQGTAIGRAGRVHVSVGDDGTIWTGGGTVTCIRGSVEL